MVRKAGWAQDTVVWAMISFQVTPDMRCPNRLSDQFGHPRTNAVTAQGLAMTVFATRRTDRCRFLGPVAPQCTYLRPVRPVSRPTIGQDLLTASHPGAAVLFTNNSDTKAALLVKTNSPRPPLSPANGPPLPRSDRRLPPILRPKVA